MTIRDQIDNYNAFRLANIANVGIPSTDYLDRQGVAFLTSVRDAVLEYDDLTDDALSEIADGAVPVYSGDILRALVDLAAWGEDTIELVQPNATIIEMAQAALYGVAYRLASALKDELDADDSMQTFTVRFADGQRATVTAPDENDALAMFDEDKTHGDVLDIFPRD